MTLIRNKLAGMFSFVFTQSNVEVKRIKTGTKIDRFPTRAAVQLYINHNIVQ